MSERRKHRVKVIGPCEERCNVGKSCESSCPPYQVPWMKGDTGPTGPAGPGFALQGRVSNTQPMLNEMSTNSVTYSSALVTPGTVLVSMNSNDPYFFERYQAVSTTSSTSLGFVGRVKMIYALRTIIDEDITSSINTYSSIALKANGTPVIFYHSDSDGNNSVWLKMSNVIDGESTWTRVPANPIGLSPSVYGDLLVVGNGNLGYFEQINGNDDIYYHGASTNTGMTDTWLRTIVYNPATNTSTSTVQTTTMANGVPLLAFVVNYTLTGQRSLMIGNSTDFVGTAWGIATILTVTTALSVLDVKVQSNMNPAVAYYNGTEVRYVSNTAFDGSGLWNDYLVETRSNVDVVSARMIILSTGYPAIFYKVVGSSGVILAINDQFDGSGTWTIYSILASLAYISTTKRTLYPINLPNGNIGLLQTSSSGLMFGFATTSSPGNWSTNLVDNTLPGSGYYPSAVILQNGYVGATYSAYGDTATVLFGRSAIKNELRIIDNTSYTMNWAVATS